MSAAERDDGGAAFPLPLGTANRAEPGESGGMTLRDYFAIHASEFDVRNALEDLGYGCGDYPAFRDASATERNAIARLVCADAMLKARKA